MGHPTERENAQEPSTNDEVSTPEQPTDGTPPESTEPGATAESVTAATPEVDEDRADVTGGTGATSEPAVSDAAVADAAPGPVEESAPAVTTHVPSAATPETPAAPAESVAPNAATPVAPSAATPAEPVVPSAATPETPAAPAEPVAPSAATPAAEPRRPSFDDDDDVPYSPRVFAFEEPVAVPVVQQVPETPAPVASTPDASQDPTAVLPVAAQAPAVPTATPSAPVATPAPTPAADVEPAQDAQPTQVMHPVVEPAAPAGSTPPASPFAPATSAWTSAATSGAATPPAQEAATGPSRASIASAFTPVGAPEGAAPDAPTDGGSPLDGISGDKAPSRLPKVALWAGIGVVVLGGLYTGAQWFYSDKVPPETTVAGVSVGGLDTTAATAALEKGLGGRAAEPITLQAGTSTTTLDPAAAGLAFDAQATADELTSFSMSPVQLWKHVFGGTDEEPVTTVDDKKLEAQVTELKARLALEPVDGNVVFTDGQPVATQAQDGAEIVEDESIEIISTSWLTGSDPLDLPTSPEAPAVTQEETDAALVQAQSVVSAPVTVAVGGQQAELTPDVLASAAAFNPTDGALQLTFDGPTLLEAVVAGTDDLLDEAADAKFVFVNGAPVIEGGEPGTTIDPAALSSAVTTAALGTERTATVELTQSDPAESVAALEALGVKEKISEFSTNLTSDAQRTENLRVGASKVNGTLVKPGETFSLTDALSPITAAGGYYSAGIVQDGKHVEGIGGGLSQMATTTYNAGFYAGLEDVEHRQHSYWFSRYPAGREATIFVGSIDMKFKNNTPYGVLMQSWIGGGQLHVAIWSTKYWTVEESSSGKQNVVEPTTVTHSGPDCVPQAKGNAGFSITTYRKLLLEGKVVKEESDRWTYKPDNQVVCGP
ncbi:VanW family protein [Oerskovia sp. KBS0722]|uniref:VanW family protein n=1 Tax=Oerskovia sp. KBS0722 TaxID=1179673 RepID=UPI00110DD20F|nr:VanW family protein [Oerskovia sp. KBS0722]QDW63939.1 vanomycin resistance protein VanB [Oerskovia sp. KBS0722]